MQTATTTEQSTTPLHMAGSSAQLRGECFLRTLAKRIDARAVSLWTFDPAQPADVAPRMLFAFSPLKQDGQAALSDNSEVALRTHTPSTRSNN